MNKALRWRIMTLQVVMVVALGGMATLAFWGGNFDESNVHDQLAAQQIYFPPATQIKAGGALDPAEFPAEIRNQAGNQVVNGDQARIYANDFILIHLAKVAGGKTYSQFPATGLTAAQTAEKATLFQGTTLRSMLLQAYGWWEVGVFASYAAIGLALAALVVLGALVFEVVTMLTAPRPEPVTAPVVGKRPALQV